MVTVKTDDRGRVKLPGGKPGQVFAWETAGEVITLTPVKPIEKDIPVVKLIKGPDGYYHFPKSVKISREDIRAAIRADRDAQ